MKLFQKLYTNGNGYVLKPVGKEYDSTQTFLADAVKPENGKEFSGKTFVLIPDFDIEANTHVVESYTAYRIAKEPGEKNSIEEAA